MATGQGSKGDFGRTLSGTGEGLVKTALGAVEGKALSFLSHGKIGPKRDGSSALRALFVQVFAGNEVAAALAASNLPSPARTAQIALQDLVPGTSFIRPFIDALPHFAGGGDVTADHPSIVGENGPELFTPRTSGRIISNRALGGGDPHNHFNIDARGSNDPEAIHAAVRRAASAIISAAIQARHHSAQRSPRGKVNHEEICATAPVASHILLGVAVCLCRL